LTVELGTLGIGKFQVGFWSLQGMEKNLSLFVGARHLIVKRIRHQHGAGDFVKYVLYRVELECSEKLERGFFLKGP